MPTSVEAHIPPVQKRLKTSTLIAMVEVGFDHARTDTLDRKAFLVCAKKILVTGHLREGTDP
jgi:hypothetical protein